MDANGTRFHLLLGYYDWVNCMEIRPAKQKGRTPEARTLRELWELKDSALEWDEQRHELTLQPRLFSFTAAPKDRPPALENRRGAARDRYGNWYWIEATRREILVNSAGSGLTSHFWQVGNGIACEPANRFGDFRPKQETPAPTPLLLSGLAVTTDHYLVVGVLEPAGLLIFDLHAGGSPRQVLWPPAVPFAPFDMAPRPDGGVWILDRDNKRYWALDRQLNVVKQDQLEKILSPDELDDFQPKGGGAKRRKAAQTFPEGISLEASSPVAAADPIAIEALPDDTVLILDRSPGGRFSQIARYHFGRQLGQASTELEIVEGEVKAKFNLIGHDFAFVAEHDNIPDRLYVAAADGNQAFAFDISQQDERLELQPVAEYLPMRLFGGKGLVAASTKVYYDFGDRWIPLVAQGRPRYETGAILETPAFDGKEPNCVWHRLMLDACLPPETEVRVWSRAANDKSQLRNVAWLPEPRLYKRSDGSELPYAKPSEINDYGTWELLFQRPRGRYLQLQLKLSGNGRTTPRLHALRAYYPRFSYLEHYLPAVYREDAESASFLDRFLANLEGFYTAIEDKVAAVQVLFDVRSAPAETLDWLANWFGVALDPAWDKAKRRLFIQHAMDFFQYRGTIRGLQMALRLALEDCADESLFADPATVRQRGRPDSIRIVELYRTRRTPGVVLGDPTEASGLRVIVQMAPWLPEQGAEQLHRLYRDALNLPATDHFPVVDPGGQRSRAWQQFAREVLGFVPSATQADQQRWREFLAQRYQDINTFNDAYQLRDSQRLTAFSEARLPDQLPEAETPLVDWYQFWVPMLLTTRWLPQEGGEALHRRYRYALQLPITALFPIRDPGGQLSSGWQQFCRDTLGFVPAANQTHEKLWQDFLARRYQNVSTLNSAYRLIGSQKLAAFTDAALLQQLPPNGAALQDWYQFEGVVLTMHSTAHIFSVLLPAPRKDTVEATAAEQQRRLDLTKRLVNLEKPVHTVFKVKFFWALFRLGAARLGEDTLLDFGSRAPQLMPPMVLGQNYLVESFLAPGHPQNVTNRQVLGQC